MFVYLQGIGSRFRGYGLACVIYFLRFLYLAIVVVKEPISSSVYYHIVEEINCHRFTCNILDVDIYLHIFIFTFTYILI